MFLLFNNGILTDILELPEKEILSIKMGRKEYFFQVYPYMGRGGAFGTKSTEKAFIKTISIILDHGVLVKQHIEKAFSTYEGKKHLINCLPSLFLNIYSFHPPLLQSSLLLPFSFFLHSHDLIYSCCCSTSKLGKPNTYDV